MLKATLVLQAGKGRGCEEVRPSGGSACDFGDRPADIVLTVGVTAADACAVSGLCNSEVHWPTAKLTWPDICIIYLQIIYT